MRFYLACVTVFALMLVGLHSCGAMTYMSVTQASSISTPSPLGSVGNLARREGLENCKSPYAPGDATQNVVQQGRAGNRSSCRTKSRDEAWDDRRRDSRRDGTICGKGGEAKRKRLKSHHKYYGYAVHDSRGLKWLALSAAVPAPHRKDTAETTKRNMGDRLDTVSPELGRTPQQIIDDAFLNIGWEQ